MFPKSRLGWAAAACVVFGVIARFFYALRLHHPRNHAWSDAFEYIALAHRFLDSPGTQGLNDTIWPPGTSAVWSLLFTLDGSLTGLAIGNATASVIVMTLVTSTAWRMAGRAAACWAAIFASLHLGYIHYTGCTLAEQFFQLTATFAVWTTVMALGTLRAEAPAKARWIWGSTAGIAWGLAALFRPNALPVLATSLVALTFYAYRTRNRTAIPLGLGVALGLLFVLVPAADRCTRNAGGNLCLVSNNIAMNMALGQTEHVYGLEFRDPNTHENATTWVPPALLHHGYTGLGHVPATIYDTRGVLRWWWDAVSAAPAAAVVRAVGNGLDLFGINYWPDNYGGLSERFAYVLKQLFFALVLIPGLLGLLRLARRAREERALSPEVMFVLSASVGVFAGATLSLGEARYRLPFDVLLLVPAAMVYAQTFSRGADDTQVRLSWGIGALAISATFAATLLAIAHPSVGLGQHLPIHSTAIGVATRRDLLDGNALSHTQKRGQPWDAPENHIFRCAPSCREALLRAAPRDPTTPWKRVMLSIDHNDRYRVYFYAHDEAVAFTDIAARGGGNGLRADTIDIPEHAQRDLDAVGVVPLYGDARYALGHIALLAD